MTYEDLKHMEPHALIRLLIHQANVAVQCTLTPATDHRIRELGAPTLMLIGDFEIRARFPEPFKDTDHQHMHTYA